MADNVQIQGIEFEVVGVSEQAANGLKPLISSLNKLKRITANGLGLKAIVQEIKDFNSALGNGETPLTGLANAINQISSSSRKLGSVHTHLDAISQLDFSNLTQAAEAIGNIAASAGSLRGFGSRRAGIAGSNLPVPYGAVDSGTEEVGGERETGTVEDQFRATSAAADSMFSNLDRNAILSFNQIDLLIAKIEILKRRLSEGLPSNGGNMGDQEIANLALQIKQAEAQLDSLQKKAMQNSSISKAFDNAKAAADNLKSKLKELAKEFGKLTLKGLKLGGNLLALPFKRLASNIQKTIAPIKQFISSIGRIAMYRMVRSAIAGITKSLTEGIKALYEYSKTAGTSFAKSMDSISASANKLKGSLASMAAPIIEALAPALDFLMSKISALLSLIAQLFAALSGKGVFTKATKGASTFGGAAGSAAKEMRMLISGFDELNAFSKSGGGGGGGGGGSGITFEEMPIAQEILDFAKKLREAFEAGDWEKLGRLLGEKINEIWDSIDWPGIGKKLGKGIDGVIRTMYSMLKTIDFKKMGADLASMVNAAFAEIHFDIAGRLLVRRITALFDMLIGFIMGLDWGLVAKSIGDFLRGAFDEAAEWLASTDFASLARTLSDAVKKILDQLIDAAGHIPWEEFGKAVGDFLANVDWWGIFTRVVRLLGEILIGVVKGAFSDWRTALLGFAILAFKAIPLGLAVLKFFAAKKALEFVMAMITPIAGMPGQVAQTGQLLLPAGKNLVGALTKGILMGVGGIAAAFWGIKDALMNGLNWLNGIVIPAGTALAGAGVGTIIGSLGGPIGAGMGAIIGLVVGGLIDLGIAIKQHWGEISAWITDKWTAFTDWVSNVWGGLTEWTSTTWTNISNAVSTGFGAAVDWVTQAATDVGTWVSNAWNTIAEQTSLTWENVKQMSIEEWEALKVGVNQAVTDVGNWISTTWTNLMLWTATTWLNIQTTVTTLFNNAKTAVVNAANEIGQWISTTWNDITTWTTTTWTEVKTTATSLFNTAKKNIVSTANTMKSNLSNTWNSIKSTASSAWESIKSTAVSKWQTLSSTLSQKWSSLRTTLSSLDWTSVGRNLVEGLMNGVGGAWNALVEKVRSLANSLIAQIKSWFGIASPSKVFAEIGEFLDAGLEQGIEYGTGDLLATAKTLANSVTNAMTPEFPSPDVWADDYSNILGDTGLTLEQEEPATGDYGEEGNGYLAGIAQAVEQMFLFMRENSNNQQGDLKVVIDGREVFNVVVAENNRAIQRTGASPIRV